MGLQFAASYVANMQVASCKLSVCVIPPVKVVSAPLLLSEVTTLWRYTNSIIIITIIRPHRIHGINTAYCNRCYM